MLQDSEYDVCDCGHVHYYSTHSRGRRIAGPITSSPSTSHFPTQTAVPTHVVCIADTALAAVDGATPCSGAVTKFRFSICMRLHHQQPKYTSHSHVKCYFNEIRNII